MTLVEGLRPCAKRQPCRGFEGALRAQVIYVPVSESTIALAQSQTYLIDPLAPHYYVFAELCSLLEISNAHLSHGFYRAIY